MNHWKNNRIIFFIIIVLVYLLFICYSNSIASSQMGLIATPDSQATKIATKILSQGGNAVDAGVAAMFALAVVEPFSAGLGGGGLIIVHMNNSNETKIIDFREVAPLNVDANVYYQSREEFEFYSSKDWGSICVPGFVAGADKALKNYGTMPIHDILSPVIELAEKGFPVSETLSQLLTKYYDFLEKNINTFSIFFPNWLPLEKDEIMTREDLAKTFRLLSDQGPEIFYQGEIANAIVQEMQMNNGFIRSPDLSDYKAVLDQTINKTYKGYKIHTAPPPSSAGVPIIELLKMLENFDLKKYPRNSGQYIHLFVEACKLVLEDRTKYLFGANDTTKINYEFPISDKNILNATKMIDSLKVRSNDSIIVSHNDIANASHISIIDKFGNAVSMSLSLNGNFGSGITLENYGVLFNNSMNNFSREPNKNISIKPRARPPISLAPTILMFNQIPFLVIGGSGGERAISTIGQIIINVVEYKLSLKEAIDSPRFYYNFYDHTIEMESRIESDAIEYLKELGHNVKLKKGYDVYFGNIQAILYDLNQREYQNMSDMRQEGVIYFN
jgi:gamma-glutamyltranspeptidase / glutathione hydrolase